MKNETMVGTYNYKGEDMQFNFYTSISAYEKLNFVDFVVDVVVGDDSYNYVIKDMIFDFNIIRFFTDVDLSEITSAENSIDAIEEFLENTNIVDIVLANAEPGIIGELIEAVELNIEYKTGIHVNPIASSLSSLLNTIERKVEGIDLDPMLRLAETMGGISGELTPEKILDAYAKTDIFKKNWANASASESGATAEKADGTTILSPAFEV